MAEERQPDRRPCERCSLWCPDAAWNAMPVSCDEERTVQASRRAEYRTEDGGGDREDSASQDKAWPLFSGGNRRAQTLS